MSPLILYAFHFLNHLNLWAFHREHNRLLVSINDDPQLELRSYLQMVYHHFWQFTGVYLCAKTCIYQAYRTHL
jgi:hypothetical protein